MLKPTNAAVTDELNGRLLLYAGDERKYLIFLKGIDSGAQPLSLGHIPRPTLAAQRR